MAGTKTGDDLVTRVYNLLGTHTDSGSKGLFTEDYLLILGNQAQRLLLKSIANSGVYEILSDLVKTQAHTMSATATTPLANYFAKGGASPDPGAILLAVGDVGLARRLPIVSLKSFLDHRTELSAANTIDRIACELGGNVHVRPIYSTDTNITEVYVDDVTDLASTSSTISLPDHLFDYLCLWVAWFAVQGRDQKDKADMFFGTLQALSGAFRGAWGVALPVPEVFDRKGSK